MVRAFQAAAVALAEMPALNGHIVLGRFYQWPSPEVAYLFPLANGSFSAAKVTKQSCDANRFHACFSLLMSWSYLIVKKK